MLNLLPKAGLHNKYCVKKARWEEHIRSVKEEEEMILEMYRQYKVRRMFETFIKWEIYKDLNFTQNHRGNKGPTNLVEGQCISSA